MAEKRCQGMVDDCYRLLERMFVCYSKHKRPTDNPAEFYTVEVDVGGYGVIWGDELDLSCDELWTNGTAIETPFDGLMSFSDATSLWCLNESTLRKAISYGKLVNGVDVCKFGKQWVVSMEAMQREYGEPPQM